jgi:hypothetical protein
VEKFSMDKVIEELEALSTDSESIQRETLEEFWRIMHQ